MIPGINVSHWQNDIDWSEVKRSGVKFAFIKATEFPERKTSILIDNKYRGNIDSAAANGIHWSAYHFFRTHIDPVIQAQVFCETVGEFSSLPPVMDLKVAESKGERLNYKVKQFLEETKRIAGRMPIVYTSGGFWQSYMAYEKQAHTDWAREYPLWIAQYTNLWPTPLYPWAGWDFWQYSDKGKLPGIKTHVDLNWFNGSEDELVKRFIYDPRLSIKHVALSSEGLAVDPVAHFMSSDPDFKGDNQEPIQLDPHTQQKVPKYTDNQENWIRSYFFDQN